MREILFRGKRRDNGEWVYGFLFILGKAVYILDSTKYTPCEQYIEVIPETVGQYTGLTDKNGEKIFEGDIVLYCIETCKTTNKKMHKVVFETKGGSAYFGSEISKIETWQFCFEVPAKLIEVVGNIHNNPELLKETEQE